MSQKYVELLLDKDKLVLASRGMIRKKHSPLARKIYNGDVKAIIRAAKSKVDGALNKVQKQKLCKVLCDMEQKFSELDKKIDKKEFVQNKREILTYGLSAITALIDPAFGMIQAILWVIYNNFGHHLCKCKFNRDCIDNSPCLAGV